ncbi:MAG TPA: bifunctional precorrin-2 dehydrogenase/sirohydrochlorin ferrochelatase [Armatimonadota bacterium]|nr:bifunctional precorrin-2 dehydrogenase/sirohydrochlorin ferrochelatase [Armatimonadota bacterium]HOS44304.1 bifunctional precorrin-2 dehydrogenase/sirohydrochlorin ferrochelatase [Armatimonadota bacterium]
MSDVPSDIPAYYPLFLDVRGKRCLVVGAGTVALRKVEGLREAGAEVLVVAPDGVPMPAGVTWHRRPFRETDVDGAWLVIAATADRAVNAAVARAADARRIWVNVADMPDESTAIMPAVVRRGALCIALSTAGSSPAFIRRLRLRLEEEFGPEYGDLLALLRALRRSWEPRAKAAGLPDAARREAWERVLELPLLDWIRAGDRQNAGDAAARVLERALAERLT